MQIGVCFYCGTPEMGDCSLYVCEDKDGFAIACCIVYAIKHNLTIIRKVGDSELGGEDGIQGGCA